MVSLAVYIQDHSLKMETMATIPRPKPQLQNQDHGYKTVTKTKIGRPVDWFNLAVLVG